jgi:DNA primase
LDAAVISRFQVGFSPAGDGLYRHLSSKGIPLNLAAEVGLIVQSSRYPSAMDRFQARVTFPVFSLSDEIAGFSARTLPGGADPKYLNSPDSEVFKKGELVFGLVQAREAVKRSGFCILVEGQVDVISMHQAGLENAVAPLGTALTEHQSAVIRRFTDTVYVMFDGDDAGVKATWRAMPILMAAGLYGKVVSLPKPEDPDSLLRKRGREALHEAVAAARPFLEFALWSITTHSGGEMHDRTVAARRGMDFAAQIPSALDRQVFLQRLATELELSPSALRVEAVKPSQPVRVQEAVEEAEPPSRQEQEMVRWVLARPELVRTVCQEGVFDLVASPAVRALMSAILESFEESGQVDVVSVVGGVTDPVLKDLCAQHMLTEKAPDGSTAEAALASLVRMLRTEHVRSHVEKLNLEIRKAQAAGDSARAWELIGERDEADRQALSLTGAPLMKAGRTKEVM